MRWVIILVITIFSTKIFGQQGEWKLKKNKDGLEVYVRDSESSDIKELRLVTSVKANLSAVIAVLQDIDAMGDWLYRCSEVKTLSTKAGTDVSYYAKIDFPWPLADRDFVANSNITQDPSSKAVIIKSKGALDGMPVKKEVVRITEMDVLWKITPQSGGILKIENQLFTNPGGSLPAWLINLAIDQGPTQSIRKMIAMANSEKYKNAKLAFLSE